MVTQGQNLRASKSCNKKIVSVNFFESRFIIMPMSDPLSSETTFPRQFCHWGSETFCLFPANLATPGNITKNNIPAMMFPSSTRPL